MVPFLEHASLHASTLIILSITVERYYAICRPLKKLSVCHKPNPLRVMPCVWSTAVLTSVPFIIMTRLERTKFFDGTPCDVCATSVNHVWHYAYIIAMFVSFFALPMLLLICLYFKIILCLRTSGTALRARQTEDVASMSTRRSRKQVVKMLVGIVVLFFISLMPVRCVIIWQIFTSDAQIQGLGPEGYYNLMWISRLLMYINSAGNPIIYSLVSSKFQEAFWRLLTGRRGEPLTGSPRGSVSTRHTSIGSRWSLTGLHRNSLSHGAGMMRNGHADRGTSVALHRIQTTSVCGWVSLQSSQGSSTFIKKEMKFSLPKQQSCASIL